MERRIPAHTTKVKVRNTCDKATIVIMVAELDSPHKVPADKDDRVHGLSPTEQADLLGPRQERGCTTGSLHADTDVLGLG